MTYLVNQAGHQQIAEFLAGVLKPKAGNHDYTADDVFMQPFALACAEQAECDATADGGQFEVRSFDTKSGRPEICNLGPEHMDYVADEQ